MRRLLRLAKGFSGLGQFGCGTRILRVIHRQDARATLKLTLDRILKGF